MKIFANECQCGQKNGGTICKICAATLPSTIHCITARSSELAKVVRRRINQGYICYDAPLKIGGGYVVQMMVARP